MALRIGHGNFRSRTGSERPLPVAHIPGNYFLLLNVGGTAFQCPLHPERLLLVFSLFSFFIRFGSKREVVLPLLFQFHFPIGFV